MNEKSEQPREMTDVREYGEGMPVCLEVDSGSGRYCISARNEGGNNGTLVDLEDVLRFLYLNGIPGNSGFRVVKR